MKASGFDEASMAKWHQKLEGMGPFEHQKLLESLGIDATEIKKTRSF